MFVYAGIDEAGYGPLLGPLVVSRSVFAIPKLPADSDPPHLWQRLSKAVCRELTKRNGRIAVNDSKKLTTAAAGLRHLELGCLAFAALAGQQPETLDAWLDGLGETCHREVDHLPWYAPCAARPWEPLPHSMTAGELAIARGMLGRTSNRIGVNVPDLGAAIVLEDRFNRMVAATRSKAATSFTFVSQHLRHVWDHFGEHHPLVAIDRQGGRSHYREPLAQAFPEAHMTVLDESPQRSAYHLTAGRRAMSLRFETGADGSHMPVALASMISKYTRELLMARFNTYFQSHAPDVRPTAGYAQDGKRFLQQIRPHLPTLGIDEAQLRRQA